MDCYSCNGCLNTMQGKDLPVPPTTTDGHPVEGSPISVAGLGSGALAVGTDNRHMASGGSSNSAPGREGA